MNRLELKEKFEKANINPYSYSFEDNYLQECYCMLKTDIGWEVFYRERGEKSKVRWFELERDACEYLDYLVFTDEVYSAGGMATSWDDFKKTGRYTLR